MNGSAGQTENGVSGSNGPGDKLQRIPWPSSSRWANVMWIRTQ